MIETRIYRQQGLQIQSFLTNVDISLF